MKRVLTTGALILAAALSFAEPVTTQDTLKAIKKLADAFDGTPAPRAEATPVEHKTMGDVADKALDLTTAAVTKIAGQMEVVAPEVWKVFILQQYAKAVRLVVVYWARIIVSILYMILVRSFWKLSEEQKKQGWVYQGDPTIKFIRGLLTAVIPTAVCLIAALSGINDTSEALMLIINPRYYAVKDILHFILAPGSM